MILETSSAQNPVQGIYFAARSKMLFVCWNKNMLTQTVHCAALPMQTETTTKTTITTTTAITIICYILISKNIASNLPWMIIVIEVWSIIKNISKLFLTNCIVLRLSVKCTGISAGHVFTSVLLKQIVGFLQLQGTDRQFKTPQLRLVWGVLHFTVIFWRKNMLKHI